jgi:hypothetical protein
MKHACNAVLEPPHCSQVVYSPSSPVSHARIRSTWAGNSLNHGQPDLLADIDSVPIVAEYEVLDQSLPPGRPSETDDGSPLSLQRMLSRFPSAGLRRPQLVHARARVGAQRAEIRGVFKTSQFLASVTPFAFLRRPPLCESTKGLDKSMPRLLLGDSLHCLIYSPSPGIPPYHPGIPPYHVCLTQPSWYLQEYEDPNKSMLEPRLCALPKTGLLTAIKARLIYFAICPAPTSVFLCALCPASTSVFLSTGV